MRTTIQKWGNSLGIRIPKTMAEDLLLEHGSEVELIEESNEIIIRPRERSRLRDLLQAIHDDNLHGEISTEGPRGREVW